MSYTEAVAAVLQQSTRIDGILFSPTYELAKALTGAPVVVAVILVALFLLGYHAGKHYASLSRRT